MKALFGSQLDFRAQLVSILAIAGIFISLIAGLVGIFIGSSLFNLLLCLLGILAAGVLLLFSLTGKYYQLCSMITVFFVFFGLFTIMFFNGGGYHSGMPSYFIFAAMYTVFLLDGKKVIVITILELSFYMLLCIYSYNNPNTITYFDTEVQLLTDIIMGFTIVSVVLSVMATLFIRQYRQRQMELEVARRQIEDLDRIKSDVFAGMSHEMRTPLTVMSAYAQLAVEQIREAGANEQTLADLATISDEAKRLAVMADDTLKMFLTTSNTNYKNEFEKSTVNIGDLSSRLAKLLEPLAARKGCKLTVIVNDNIPAIPGNSDALTQLIWNLLQNSMTHSACKTIVLQISKLVETGAGTENNCVKVTVYDDGVGIDPAILSNLFERGVSGREGGSGIGLSICREIAKQHDGDINIQSEPGSGTVVTVLLRG
ncbi:MAG: HAMP domain-containing histidine kinase [Treponema sp.]|jgi:signal transduction histidine kinase|nr:HAMP domain-containing histidine kinase [Treponema sp.]